MARNRLMDNVRVDLQISPDLQNLMNHNQEIAPEATKLGLRKVTKEGSKQTKEKIKSLGLVKSGALMKSVRGTTTKSKSVIGTKMWYANFLEGGTKTHKIKAKKGKYLRIPINGRSLFVKGVNHPGNKAYDFFEGTFDKMQASGEVKSLFSQGVQEAIEELSR
jgi:phage gpG-like protein